MSESSDEALYRQIGETFARSLEEMTMHLIAVLSLMDQYVSHLRDFTRLWDTMRIPLLLMYDTAPADVKTVIDSAEMVRMQYLATKDNR
jgi:hypothetical protein